MSCKRFLASLLLAAILVGVAGSAGLAGPKPWVPNFNSPPSPSEIQSDWGTPAQDTTPDAPWRVGYPYDKVPEHPEP